MFGFFKRRRRRRILAEAAPAVWADWVGERVSYWKVLTEEEQQSVLRICQVLLAEKHWYGRRGLVLTEEIQVVIAAQAAILLLGLEHDYYRNVKTIIVFPADYDAPQNRFLPPEHRGEGVRLGEAHGRGGPVALSWHDVKRGAASRKDGENLVFHEFAHKLDLGDGWADGMPVLRDREQTARWREVMSAELAGLQDRVERGRRSLLDDYGATNEAEFFAVCTEVFFEQPQKMRAKYREIYELLGEFYGQDPAARMT